MNPVDPWEFFRDWLLDDPATRVPLTLTTLGVLLVLPLVGFAAYMWRMTTRAMAERAFPPSGYMVIGKKPPISGDEALRYARIVRVLALFLLAAAMLLVFQLWRFAVLLTPRT